VALYKIKCRRASAGGDQGVGVGGPAKKIANQEQPIAINTKIHATIILRSCLSLSDSLTSASKGRLTKRYCPPAVLSIGGACVPATTSTPNASAMSAKNPKKKW